MAYDEDLAQRIREHVTGEPGLSEQKMFGGLAFLVNGNMAVAASGRGGLMLRCDPGDSEELSASDGVAPMEMRGRRMDGWLSVADDVVADDACLARWAGVGVAYARTLPAK
jgi:hypothetical protein